MEIEPLPPHKGCFGCGPDNLAGLQLRLVREDSLTKAEFLPTQDYAGYEGLVHGGIVSLLFDEVMGTAAGYGKDLPCMSAELTIRYVQPLPIDKKYILIGEVTADKHRLWLTRGEIRVQDLANG